MKKKYMIILIIAVVITLMGCSGRENTDSVNKKDTIESDQSRISENDDEKEGAATEEAGESLLNDKKGTGEVIYEGFVNEDGEYELQHVDTENEEVIVPDMIDGAAVVKIGAHAFENEESIKKIVLPDTVKKIGTYAFSGCASLEQIELGDGIDSIENMAFDRCFSLQTVKIPEGTTYLEGLFYACKELKEVYIPASVTDIQGLLLDPSSPNAIVVTPKGSTAEEHAKKYDIPYRNE